MQKYGMIKKYKVIAEDGTESEVVLTANVLTYIIYKNFTGRDLQSDILKSLVTPDNAKLLEALKSYGLTAQDLESDCWLSKMNEQQLETLAPLLNGVIDVEFNINFVAALIATSEYPKLRSFEDTIMSIPPGLIYDADFLQGVYEMLTMYVKGSKKK